jgi:hypothetical protein
MTKETIRHPVIYSQDPGTLKIVVVDPAIESQDDKLIPVLHQVGICSEIIVQLFGIFWKDFTNQPRPIVSIYGYGLLFLIPRRGLTYQPRATPWVIGTLYISF